VLRLIKIMNDHYGKQMLHFFHLSDEIDELRDGVLLGERMLEVTDLVSLITHWFASPTVRKPMLWLRSKI
jgi:hypothetical protein